MLNKIHLRIGKNGITPGVINDLNEKFEQTDPVVIKFLKNFRETRDRREAAEQLAEQTMSRVEKLVGGTLILTRTNKKKPSQKGGRT